MRLHRRTVLSSTAAAAATLALAPSSFAREEGPAALAERLNAALRTPVERGDIPMAVGGLADADGVIHTGAFGVKRLGDDEPVTVDSVFNIAAMTQAITTVAAMQLVERGELDLDSPISTWIRSADDLQVLEGFDGSGRPIQRAPARAITLRHLMTHTSGHAYVQWDEKLKRYADTRDGLPFVDYADERTWMQPLMFDPGDDWRFGGAADWIGRLIVVVSGETLAGYMRTHVFEPLGMTSTRFGITPDMETRRVSVHRRAEDGALRPTDFVMPQDLVRDYGGGGLYGTAPDYLRFVRMILNEGSLDGVRILRPETVAEMSRDQMGDLGVHRLDTTDPERSGDVEFFPGLAKSWGLGFMINEERAPTGRSAGSLAWAGLYNTYFWIDPVEGIGGVFMSQVLPFVDPKTLAAFHAFETACYEADGA